MSNTENAKAAREARETVTRASDSANRQRLWAGLNRYLAAEGEHARKAARKDAEAERKRRPSA
jgi:hypothetical protein